MKQKSSLGGFVMALIVSQCDLEYFLPFSNQDWYYLWICLHHFWPLKNNFHSKWSKEYIRSSVKNIHNNFESQWLIFQSLISSNYVPFSAVMLITTFSLFFLFFCLSFGFCLTSFPWKSKVWNSSAKHGVCAFRSDTSKSLFGKQLDRILRTPERYHYKDYPFKLLYCTADYCDW